MDDYLINTITPHVEQKNFEVKMVSSYEIDTIKIYIDIKKLKVDTIDELHNITTIFMHSKHDNTENTYHCCLDELYDGILIYPISDHYFDTAHLTMSCAPTNIKLIYKKIDCEQKISHLNKLKDNHSKFLIKKINDRFNISNEIYDKISNIKIILSKQHFNQMKCLQIVANGYSIYNLEKTHIDIMNNHYILGNNVILSCVHLPEFIMYYLSMTNLYLTIDFNNHEYIEYYVHMKCTPESPKNRSNLLDNKGCYTVSIFNGIRHMNMRELNQSTVIHYIPCANYNVSKMTRRKLFKSFNECSGNNNSYGDAFFLTELLCITDLTDIFKEFYTLFQSTHYLYTLPADVWGVIGSYLKRDYIYLQIIMEIYNNSTDLDYEKKISIIDYNILVYCGGMIGTKYVR